MQQGVCAPSAAATPASDYAARTDPPPLRPTTPTNIITACLQVYSPVAPTTEMLEMVSSLQAPVEHIIAPSLSPEHWLYVNAFSRAHPDATVWVCPGAAPPWQRCRRRARPPPALPVAPQVASP
jgi:hypothetical protein